MLQILEQRSKGLENDLGEKLKNGDNLTQHFPVGPQCPSSASCFSSPIDCLINQPSLWPFSSELLITRTTSPTHLPENLLLLRSPNLSLPHPPNKIKKKPQQILHSFVFIALFTEALKIDGYRNLTPELVKRAYFGLFIYLFILNPLAFQAGPKETVDLSGALRLLRGERYKELQPRGVCVCLLPFQKNIDFLLTF